MRRLVTFKDCGSYMELRPDAPLSDLAECSNLFALLEYQLCNGWEVVQPEECGALTCGLLISDEAERDDSGTLIALGRVLWDEAYAVRCALSELQAGNPVRFLIRL